MSARSGSPYRHQRVDPHCPPRESCLVRFAIAAVLAALLVASAGCGESKQCKASKQVCSARSDLQKNVNELSSLTISTASVNGIKDNVNAITNDLKKIKDAQGNLNAARKAQVQQATQEFESQLSSIAKSIGGSTSLSSAATQLQSAAKQLAASYKQTLAKVDCS